MLNNTSDPKNRLLVVLDEFQEIVHLEPGTDKLLRGVMQLHENLNYVFLGREEGMMTSIFEDIKSPFFHFSAVMHLGQFPFGNFLEFLQVRLEKVRAERACEDAHVILELTKCHPFYTQQLATAFWDLCVRAERSDEEPNVQMAANEILFNLSASYFSLWSRLNRTNWKILEALAHGIELQDMRSLPTNTVYSAATRLKKKACVSVIRSANWRIPFSLYGPVAR